MRPIVLTEPGTIIEPSELIINPDGSIYHLALRPDQLGDLVFVVGDQGRVELISRHFQKVEHKVQNREFVAHTGVYNGTHVQIFDYSQNCPPIWMLSIANLGNFDFCGPWFFYS